MISPVNKKPYLYNTRNPNWPTLHILWIRLSWSTTTLWKIGSVRNDHRSLVSTLVLACLLRKGRVKWWLREKKASSLNPCFFEITGTSTHNILPLKKRQRLLWVFGISIDDGNLNFETQGNGLLLSISLLAVPRLIEVVGTVFSRKTGNSNNNSMNRI